ncbi:DUF3574 domain-containing protein [Anderseniella sp. Alg231-50]|uniref:DUF3574 domain-containing protein n=1 Tax=Anderseniella sp. Alg231-50 TaxID=1922226 RepID=UPI00307B6669
MKRLSVFCCVIAVVLLATPGKIVHAQGKPQANCPLSKFEWIETKLFMGLSRSTGAAVSRREWDKFVTDNFVAEFPQGFTIIETTGYWQHENTKATVYENGRQVVILHEATPGNEAMINEIAERYRSRFDQQSVLISSNRTNVRFCTAP